jgi:hypothetical protein
MEVFIRSLLSSNTDARYIKIVILPVVHLDNAGF